MQIYRGVNVSVYSFIHEFSSSIITDPFIIRNQASALGLCGECRGEPVTLVFSTPQGLGPSPSQSSSLTVNTDFCLSKPPVHSYSFRTTKKRPLFVKDVFLSQKKVSFQFHSDAWQLRSVKVISAFWMRLSMHSFISNQSLQDKMESLEFWFSIICRTLNKPLKRLWWVVPLNMQ